MVDATWKQKYEVGNPRIDFEHRIFLDLIDQFAGEAEAGASSKRLSRTCAELYKYADFHFFSEEGMMEDAGWNEIEGHKALHRSLLDQLRSYIDSVAMDLVRTDQMVEFLMLWFIGHTTTEDKKLAAVLGSASPYSSAKR